MCTSILPILLIYTRCSMLVYFFRKILLKSEIYTVGLILSSLKYNNNYNHFIYFCQVYIYCTFIPEIYTCSTSYHHFPYKTYILSKNRRNLFFRLHVKPCTLQWYTVLHLVIWSECVCDNDGPTEDTFFSCCELGNPSG